jgi:hypothetical protein
MNSKLLKLQQQQKLARKAKLKGKLGIYTLSRWAVWYLALGYNCGLFHFVHHQRCGLITWNKIK